MGLPAKAELILSSPSVPQAFPCALRGKLWGSLLPAPLALHTQIRPAPAGSSWWKEFGLIKIISRFRAAPEMRLSLGPLPRTGLTPSLAEGGERCTREERWGDNFRRLKKEVVCCYSFS